MNLYEIDAQMMVAFEAAIDTETGEVKDEEVLERFEQLQMDRDTKVENVAVFIKNLRAEAAALKAEKDALAKRQKAAENKADSLSKYLAGYLNGEAFKSARAAVSWRKSESVSVTDISKLPMEYLTFKPAEANKQEIKAALKAGKTVEGAELIQNMNMTVK